MKRKLTTDILATANEEITGMKTGNQAPTAAKRELCKGVKSGHLTFNASEIQLRKRSMSRGRIQKAPNAVGIAIGA